MKTKIDLSAMESYLTNETEPEYVVSDLIAIEEKFVLFVMRDKDLDNTAADLYYSLITLRKQFQLLL